jgi:hypothetical protein
MKRVVNFTSLVSPNASFLLSFQTVMGGLRRATDNNDIGSGYGNGSDSVRWQASSAFATATKRVIDTRDWRDRWIWGWVFPGGDGYGTSSQRIGQSNDYELDPADTTAGTPSRMVWFTGYTGSGAVSHLTTGAVVSNGNPPLQGVGTYRSYAVKARDPVRSVLVPPVLWVFADETGQLCLYNNCGSDLYPLIQVCGTGDLNKR